MRMPWLVAALVAVATPVFAAGPAPITGEYVEARTAEVFTGGCIMSSEAETIGRQAVMAWHINHGAFNGVALDGLSVIAAVAGDRNLGIREIGGVAPTAVRAAVIVDSRATTAQRDALVAFVRRISGGLIDEIVNVSAAPVTFESDGHQVRVAAAEAKLAVARHLHHDPSCGAMQWFHPLAAVNEASMGLTAVNTFSGRTLGTRWSDPNRRSGFVGTFTL
jgi:hypothetical protein